MRFRRAPPDQTHAGRACRQPWGAQTFVTGQFLRTEGGVTGVLKNAKGKLVADAAAQIDDASGWRQLEFPKEVGDWLGVAAQFVKIGQQLRQERQQLGRCFEHRFAPGLPLYLLLRRGANAMHLFSEHEGDARPNTLVYLYVDDIEAAALWNTMAHLLERCAHDEQERHLSDASRLCGRIAEHEVTAMSLLASL